MEPINPYTLPVSAKGILLVRDAVLLVGNSRGEFELPGGRIEPGETPERAVQRELAEEVGLEPTVHEPVHAWVYEITSSDHVFVIAYGISVALGAETRMQVDVAEVGHADLVPLADVHGVNMPTDYCLAIERWRDRERARQPG